MIRPRGSSLQIRVYVGVDPATGRERYLYRTTKAGRRAAERIERELLAKVERGDVTDRRVTVGELLDRWLEHATPTIEQSTAELYGGVIEQHLKPALGRLPVEKLSAAHLDRLYDELGERGLSPARVGHVHAAVRGACRQAVRWRWILVNPALDASPPTVRAAELVIPTAGEIDAQIAWARAHDRDLAVLIRLAACSGMRRGELVALRWCDVALDGDQVTVARALSSVKGSVVGKSTKGRRARTIALDGETIAMLRAHRTREVEKALKCGRSLAVSSPAFTGMPGRAWYPDTATARYRSARAAAGGTAGLHGLRHWHASQLLAAGVPITTVSARLGHASTKMTLDVYGHMIDAHDAPAASAIAALLAK